MKLELQILTLATTLSFSALPAQAAVKGEKGPARKPGPGAPARAGAQSEAPGSPSERLALFLSTGLDRMLAPLDKGIPGKVRGKGVEVIKVPPATRARVTKLDQHFRAEAGEGPPAKQAMFQRAMAVTAVLARIMDERDKQTGLFVNSRTTRSLSDLEKKDTKADRRDARQEIHETKNFISSGLEQRWLETAADYRKQVNERMELLRAAEREAKAAKGAP